MKLFWLSNTTRLQWLDRLTRRFNTPRLTRTRAALALAVAVMADVLQVLLLPLEAVFAQQIIDLGAMVVTSWLLGFHPLLLPTFLVELIPVVDILPTWTGCVIAVVALRKRAEWVAGTQVNPRVNPIAPPPPP